MPVSQNLGGALVGGYSAASWADLNRKKLMEEQRQAMATQFKDNFERAIGLVKDSAVALDKIRTNAEGGEQSKQYQNAQSVYGKMATTTIQSTLDLAQKMEAQGVLPQGSVQQYAAMFGAAGNITPADVEIGLGGMQQRTNEMSKVMGKAEGELSPPGAAYDRREHLQDLEKIELQRRQVVTNYNPDVIEAAKIEQLQKALGEFRATQLTAALKAPEGILRDERSMSLLREGIKSGITGPLELVIGKALVKAGLTDSPEIAATEELWKQRAGATLEL